MFIFCTYQYFHFIIIFITIWNYFYYGIFLAIYFDEKDNVEWNERVDMVINNVMKIKYYIHINAFYIQIDELPRVINSSFTITNICKWMGKTDNIVLS